MSTPITSSFPSGFAQVYNPTPGHDDDVPIEGVVATILPQWWGARGDGKTDCTAAIQAAVNTAGHGRNLAVQLPAGTYLVTGTIRVPNGARIVGSTGAGNVRGRLTRILHASNEDLFVWSGEVDTAFCGVGGGLIGLTLMKADHWLGGDAIRLEATDDDHKPGEMVFREILVGGEGSGQWERGLKVDGSRAVKDGQDWGIRSLLFEKVRVAACNHPHECVVLDTVKHVSATLLDVDGVGGGPCPGMTVRASRGGSCDNLDLGVLVNGRFIADGKVNFLSLRGRVAHLDIRGRESVSGAFLGHHATFLSNSSRFRLASGNQNRWNVRANADPAAATGDGSFIELGPWRSEPDYADIGSFALTDGTCYGFDGTLHAPVHDGAHAEGPSLTNGYRINASAQWVVGAQFSLRGLRAEHSSGRAQIVVHSADGLLKVRAERFFNPSALRSQQEDCATISIHEEMHLRKDDVVTVRVSVGVEGGGKTARVASYGTPTTFYGHMI
mgnify:CR=1 FL=1